MKNKKQHYVYNGGRIYLRNVDLSDVNENYHNWMNDKEVVQFLEARFSKNSPEDIRSFVIETNKNPDTVFLAICLKDSNLHIGNVKVHRIDRNHKSGEVSILIGEKKCWGKGYGAEAINLISEYVFSTLNLNKLTAECYANNLGSLNAFKKAGFKEEGIRKKQYFYNGSYVDSYMFGRIRQE